jgi:hypothetical protein
MSTKFLSPRFQSKVNQLLTELINEDFYIEKHDLISGWYRIRLGCGMVVSMYERNGKFMVQGTFDFGNYGYGTLEALIQILPPYTNWLINEIRTPHFAAFIKSYRAESKQKRSPSLA